MALDGRGIGAGAPGTVGPSAGRSLAGAPSSSSSDAPGPAAKVLGPAVLSVGAEAALGVPSSPLGLEVAGPEATARGTGATELSAEAPAGVPPGVAPGSAVGSGGRSGGSSGRGESPGSVSGGRPGVVGPPEVGGSETVVVTVVTISATGATTGSTAWVTGASTGVATGSTVAATEPTVVPTGAVPVTAPVVSSTSSTTGARAPPSPSRPPITPLPFVEVAGAWSAVAPAVSPHRRRRTPPANAAVRRRMTAVRAPEVDRSRVPPAAFAETAMMTFQGRWMSRSGVLYPRSAVVKRRGWSVHRDAWGGPAVTCGFFDVELSGDRPAPRRSGRHRPADRPAWRWPRAGRRGRS